MFLTAGSLHKTQSATQYDWNTFSFPISFDMALFKERLIKSTRLKQSDTRVGRSKSCFPSNGLMSAINDLVKSSKFRQSYTHIFISSTSSYASSPQTSLLLNGYRGSLLGIKRLGRDVDQSPPHSAEFKNGAIPPIPLHAFMAWTGTTLFFHSGIHSLMYL